MTSSAHRQNLKRAIHDVLGPCGFQRKGSSWTRAARGFIDFVGIQNSKGIPYIYINLGVVDEEVYRLSWDRPLPDKFNDGDCIARARLDELMNGVGSMWDPTKPEVIAEIATGLSQFGLPFLDSMSDRAALIRHLESSNELRSTYPPPHLYLAILKDLGGDKAGAREVLARLDKITPQKLKEASVEWTQHIEQIQRSIG